VANHVYPKALEGFGKGLIDYTSDTINVALVNDASYVSSHEFLSSIAAGRIGTDETLTSKSVTSGDFFAGSLTFTAVPVDPDDIVAVVVYVDSGSSATSRLLAWIDTDSTSNPIAITPNGGDINVTWPLGKVFSI
jgi:hypothetical protein